MKKVVSLFLAAVTVSLSAAAYGADYKDGIVTSEETGVKTVLITKAGDTVTNDSIYYVDQARYGDALNAAAGFLMKANPVDGDYNLYLGFNDVGKTGKQAKIIPFTIGSVEDEPMNPLTGDNSISYNADGSFNMGFTTGESGIKLADYNSLKIQFDNKVLGYPLNELGITNVEGDGNVLLGIQINNIPEKYKGKVQMWFTADVTIPNTEGEEDENI